MATLLNPKSTGISDAAALIEQGDLVVIPTETVYGLGANAFNEDAVAKIFETKGRPNFNPLIVHVDDVSRAENFADLNDTAPLLAQMFWPGPLTLIVPLLPDHDIAPNVTAGLKTVGIRMPAHDVALRLIEAADTPIAAPSANASGKLSPTKPEHVMESLGEACPPILIGGKSVVGLESTIVDVTGDVPKILRAGAITRGDLQSVLGDIEDMTGHHDDESPSSPGQLLKHYAPKTKLRLNAVDVSKGEALLAFGETKFMGIKGGGRIDDLPDGHMLNLSAAGDLTEAAGNLFSMLHSLDGVGAYGIAVMNIPNQGIGRAINDRLTRAARG